MARLLPHNFGLDIAKLKVFFLFKRKEAFSLSLYNHIKSHVSTWEVGICLDCFNLSPTQGQSIHHTIRNDHFLPDNYESLKFQCLLRAPPCFRPVSGATL